MALGLQRGNSSPGGQCSMLCAGQVSCKSTPLSESISHPCMWRVLCLHCQEGCELTAVPDGWDGSNSQLLILCTVPLDLRCVACKATSELICKLDPQNQSTAPLFLPAGGRAACLLICVPHHACACRGLHGPTHRVPCPACIMGRTPRAEFRCDRPWCIVPAVACYLSSLVSSRSCS